jgi:hypothetical protein
MSIHLWHQAKCVKPDKLWFKFSAIFLLNNFYLAVFI